MLDDSENDYYKKKPSKKRKKKMKHRRYDNDDEDVKNELERQLRENAGEINDNNPPGRDKISKDALTSFENNKDDQLSTLGIPQWPLKSDDDECSTEVSTSPRTNYSPRFQANPLIEESRKKAGTADLQTAEPQTNSEEIERKERDLKQKLFSLQEPQYKELTKQSPRVGDFSPRSKNKNKNRQNRAAEKHKNRMKNSRQNKLKSKASNNSNYHAQLQRKDNSACEIKGRELAYGNTKAGRGLEARKVHKLTKQ